MSLVHGPTPSGNKVVHIGARTNDGRFEPKPIGWKRASAYYCFCRDHDHNIFKPIENNVIFNPNHLEHLFLHSFRSFAYGYYRKQLEYLQISDFTSNISDITSILTKFLGNSSGELTSDEKTLRDNFSFHFWSYESVRKKLLDILHSRSFDQLYYCYALLPMRYPFASAGVLMARIVDPGSNKLTFVVLDEDDPIVKEAAIMLTLIPDKQNRMILIMACLKSDGNAMHILRKFDRLNDGERSKAITSLVLTVNKDNTFFNPALWDYMVNHGIDQTLIREINHDRGLDLLIDEVRLSSLNLFDSRFTCASLGITS